MICRQKVWIGVVAVALALAVYSLAQKQLLTKFSALQITMIAFGSGAVLLLPLTAGNLSQVVGLSWPVIGLLSFCVIATLGAFGSHAEALRHWEATKIGAVHSTVPLIALGFAELTVFVFPGIFTTEPISFLSMIGAMVLVIGSYMVARKN